MCNIFLYIATLLAFVHIVRCETPSFITKCKQTDENCYKQNAENMRDLIASGIPEYNIEQLDPMKIKKIDASNNNLELVMKDIYLTGAKDCDIKKLAHIPSKGVLSASLLCNINVESEYKIKGKLSIFPIEGEGKLNVKIRKILINGEVKMVTYQAKDGKRHWKVPSWTHNFDLQDKSYIHFEHLFDGNSVLKSGLENFIDQNGNDIIYDVGEPIVKNIIGKLVEALNHLFKELSIEDISID